MSINSTAHFELVFKNFLNISGTNKVILIGANSQEIDFTRIVLKNRWPYPCSRDEELILDDKNKAWLFKLKRHPWAISYGHKHIDRAVELAQTLLHKPIAPPKNTDADSGKSILIFLLRVCTVCVKNFRSICCFWSDLGVL